MSDLAERLDDLADDGTRGVSFPPLDVAAKAHRRHRNRLRAGLAGAACAAAVALLVVVLVPAHSNAVRVATITPTNTPGPTSASGPASATSDVWARIAAVAHDTALEFGDPTPTSVEAVTTNLKAYEQATGERSAPGDATTEVYLVMMTGRFTCRSSCFNVSGNTPTGAVLSIALDMSPLAVRAVSLTNQPIRLDQLGAVHHLELSHASANNGTSALHPGVDH